MAGEFISEDDLDTFDGWMRVQGFPDITGMAPDTLGTWLCLYDEVRNRNSLAPKLGLMKLKPLVSGEYRYAVAVQESSGLLLVLWVRRSPKGELFVMTPRPDQGWNAHTSYHRDGTIHMKHCGHTARSPQKRQPITAAFQGTEHLGVYYGHTPKINGAICDPSAFSGVVKVQPGVLGPRDGGIMVDLVEPGRQPMSFQHDCAFPFRCGRVVLQKVFRDTLPWIVIRVA